MATITNNNLLEKILSKENMTTAYYQVIGNKGSYGVDKVSIDELKLMLNKHWKTIKGKLLDGTYNPNPVRRVTIPKPDGGERLLGIPTVFDRMIQQAIAQQLTEIYDKQFSNSSYGFRPNRSAKDALLKAQEYINEGYKYVVDMDLEKFFDKVNHDILMSKLEKDITDKRVVKLIRKYLQSGVMINGVVMTSEEGTPQGGNLSPILSNIMLDEVDKELEKRGHKFCRYADDCNIYVKSKKAGNRVYKSIKKLVEKKLKLRVNEKKSAIDIVTRRKFLGFSFYFSKDGAQIRVHLKSLRRFKEKIKEITNRNKGISLEYRLFKLRQMATPPNAHFLCHYLKIKVLTYQ